MLAASLSWFALRVRTRSELLVGLVLQQKGFECFTPTYPEERKYTDRQRKVSAPLFPGYVFGRFSSSDNLQIVTTPGVQKILTNGVLPAPIPDLEIESLRRAAASVSVCPYPYLTIGQKVRVREGLFSGLEGFLVSIKGKDRLVVSVDVVESAIAVEVAPSQLELISSPDYGFYSQQVRLTRPPSYASAKQIVPYDPFPYVHGRV